MNDFEPTNLSRPAALFPVIAACLLAISPATGNTGQAPLHQRIDEQLQKESVTPLAGTTGDEDFVRRAYLDLHGFIPTTDQTRSFLADESSDKRAKLVDELLAKPEFHRHMARSFDIMLMERRKETHVKTDPWRDFLFAAFARNEPYNELARDVLAADGVDKDKHSLARFYLDREAEPTALTRDIGRIFFGMDLQCAQCHNHPRIDDYLQRDYYGINAFVNRTSLFRPDKKKPAVLAESATGDSDFKSVFTGVEGTSRPRLPGGKEVVEPVMAKDKEWKVKPDKKKKTLRPIPAYSRRENLPKLIVEGTNEAFRHNIVNRLWAHMMGRGLVEPLDFHHSGNPPTHPELLKLLAVEFAVMKFDVKNFLRELALTRAYQRSLELPELVAGESVRAAKTLAAVETESRELQKAATAAWDKLEKLRSELAKSFKSIGPVQADLKKAEAERVKVKKSHESAKAALATVEKSFNAKQKQLDDLVAAANKIKAGDIGKNARLKKAFDAADKAAKAFDKGMAVDREAREKAISSEKSAAAKVAAIDKTLAQTRTKIEAQRKAVAAIEREMKADLRRQKTVEAVRLASTKLHESAKAALATAEKLYSAKQKQLDALVVAANKIKVGDIEKNAELKKTFEAADKKAKDFDKRMASDRTAREKAIKSEKSAADKLSACEKMLAQALSKVETQRKAAGAIEEVIKAELRNQTQAEAAKLASIKLHDSAKVSLGTEEKLYSAKQKQLDALITTASKLKAEGIAEDVRVKKAFEAADKRAKDFDKRMATDRKAREKAISSEKSASDKVAVSDKLLAEVRLKIEAQRKAASAIEKEIATADLRRRTEVEAAKVASNKVKNLTALVEFGKVYEAARAKGATDEAKARLDAGLDELTAVFAESFAVAGLTPLTPEQLCWSMMQATGELDRYRDLGAAEFKKKAASKDKKKLPVPNDEARYVEQYTYSKLKARVAGFVSLFGNSAGAPQNAFYATADQALFFENANDLRGWLNPSGKNLVMRLRDLKEPKAFAEELYLSVMARQPTKNEIAAVAALTKGREKDLTKVAQEAAAALLTSIEFRFKH